MSSLEKQRLLQDSRRRSVVKLDDHVTKMRGKFNSDHPKLTRKIEDKHRQDVKLQRASPARHGRSLLSTRVAAFVNQQLSQVY